MAVVNVKSSVVTNLDAVPTVKSNRLALGGAIRSAFGVAAFASSDATSVARVLRLPSRAKVTRVEYASDDLGTGGTIDIGLHRTTADGGAVVSVAFFASALNTDSAAVARSDVTYEAGTFVIANSGKALWDALTLTADPGVDYDVTVTRNTATGTGNVALWIEYVLDES